MTNEQNKEWLFERISKNIITAEWLEEWLFERMIKNTITGKPNIIKEEINLEYGTVVILKTIFGAILGIKIRNDKFYIKVSQYHYYGTMMEIANILDDKEKTSELHLLLSMTK